MALYGIASGSDIMSMGCLRQAGDGGTGVGKLVYNE